MSLLMKNKGGKIFSSWTETADGFLTCHFESVVLPSLNKIYGNREKKLHSLDEPNPISMALVEVLEAAWKDGKLVVNRHI